MTSVFLLFVAWLIFMLAARVGGRWKATESFAYHLLAVLLVFFGSAFGLWAIILLA